MPSPQVQPLPQGPPSLVEGLRAEGSADDEVLVIALAALVLCDKRCGGPVITTGIMVVSRNIKVPKGPAFCFLNY